MKLLVVFLLIISIYCAVPREIYAHPGNTAADGCHYCRTNCDKWGVPWNERHCHGGGSAPAPQAAVAEQTAPVVATPILVPTVKPTATPRPSIQPTVKPSPSVAPSPSVTPSQSTTPSPSIEASSSAAVMGLSEIKTEPKKEVARGFWSWLFSLFK